MFGENMCIESAAGKFVYSVALFPSSLYDCMWYAWDEAQTEAEVAYSAWRGQRSSEAYAVYRAAQDRADAAQDALASCHRESAAAYPGGSSPRPASRDAVSGRDR